MTYAGIKSLIYCGVVKKDERVKKAYEWIQNNYTVDKNPGMPEVRSQWGMYYYYHTMAKCLRCPGAGLRGRCQRGPARLAQGHHPGPGQAAAARRQLRQHRSDQLDGKRRQPGHRLCADGPELLPAEVKARGTTSRKRKRKKPSLTSSFKKPPSQALPGTELFQRLCLSLGATKVRNSYSFRKRRQPVKRGRASRAVPSQAEPGIEW